MTTGGIEILYEDGPCLAVLKPSGVLTQAPPGIDSLETRIKEFLKRREGKTGNVYLGVPHRLDRPVSGVMVFSRHVRAARRLAEQFEGRLVQKSYWAFVEGHVDPRQGTWTDYVRKVPAVARAEVVSPDHPEGRRAVLHYRTVQRGGPGSLLEIELETGRTHQVRVQSAARGHSILGDALYGARSPFGRLHEDPRENSIALHARCLSFRHPMTREQVTVTAPLTADWESLLQVGPEFA